MIELQQNRPKHNRREQRPEKNRDLLKSRCRAYQEAGLQILRSGAPVGDRDAHDAADRKRGNEIARASPADEKKDQAGQEERRHRHT